MTENNRNQKSQQANIGSQERSIKDQSNTEQETSDKQQVSRDQIGRLESQPGNISGVDIESQRTRSDNQDLASREGRDRQASAWAS